MQKIKLIFVFFTYLIFSNAEALTRVDISRANIEPVPIAFPHFIAASSNKGLNLIYQVAADDLVNSNLFRIVNREAYIEEIVQLGQRPNFISWRQINASVLILTEVVKDSGHIYLRVVIWDIYSEKKIYDSKMSLKDLKYREAGHILADNIYEVLTGEKGYFNSKIVYIEMARRNDFRARKLAIMDYDGANLKYLTSGDHLVMTPRISFDGKKILYLSYENPRMPRVKIIDISTGHKSLVGTFPGMTYAPRYTAKAAEVLMSAEEKGVSNIYFYNLFNGKKQQVTFCNSICTSPSESPDGKRIVFNSDMSGGRNLFVMDKDGKNIKRISFGEGYYTTPVWSPRGDLIAFTKSVQGEGFYIGVMKPDGSGERIIANGWLVEGPSWSPNGRLILFEKSNSASQANASSNLYTIDISGNFETKIETPRPAIDGDWSKLIR